MPFYFHGKTMRTDLAWKMNGEQDITPLTLSTRCLSMSVCLSIIRLYVSGKILALITHTKSHQ